MLPFDYKKAQLTQGLRANSIACMKAPMVRNLSSVGNSTLEPNITSIGKLVAKLWPFFVYPSRHLEFYRTANCAIRSADPENPGLKPSMEWIGCTVCEIFAFKLYCDLETGARSTHLRLSRVAINQSIKNLKRHM